MRRFGNILPDLFDRGRRIGVSLRDPLSRPKVGSPTLTELLSWGLPITVAGICIGLAFGVLQLNEVGTDEFWISRGFFVVGALIVVARIVLWEATTARPALLRVLVGVVAIGFTVPLTVEAVRYVNRKHARWIEAQKPAAPPVPLPELPTVKEPDTKEASQSQEKPNLVFKIVRHLNTYEEYGMLYEGRKPGYSRDPTLTAVTLLIENEFSDQFRAVPVSGVTAQLIYRDSSGHVYQVNRGAWLGGDNRVGFNVNDAKDLIVAVLVNDEDDEPFVVAIVKEYQHSGNSLGKVAQLLEKEFYRVRVKLINEQLGIVYGDREFDLKITQDPFDVDLVPYSIAANDENV